MTSPRPPRTRTKAASPPAPEDQAAKTSPLFLPPEDPPPAPPFASLPEGLQPANPAEITYPDPPSSPPNPFAAAIVAGSPSDTPSTDKPAKLTRGSVRGFAKKLLVAAGKYAQGRLTAPNSPERMEGLWLPDDEDVKDVADPVAGLVMRRIPSRAGGIIANPDLEDGFTLLLAVAAYVGKQLEKKDRIRQLYTQVTPDMTADDAEAVPA